jgi:integrase
MDVTKPTRNPKANVNGQGSLFKRVRNGKTSWVSQLMIGRDDVGRLRWKQFYGKTAKEALDKGKDWDRKRALGAIPTSSNRTLGMWLMEHLNEQRDLGNIRNTTWIAHENIIRNHIIPHVGGVKLTSFTSLQVRELLVKLARSGAPARRRQYVHSILHKALRDALVLNHVAKNVVHGLQRPPVPHSEVSRALSPLEAKQLVATAAHERLRALYVLAVHTGMREGELLALQWQNVDMKNGTIKVRATLNYEKGKLTLGPPKTKMAYRTLGMSKDVKAALIGHKERMFAEGHTASWVFCDTQGGPLRFPNIHRRSFKPLLGRAGLPNIRFHDLRHTAITFAAKHVKDLKALQVFAGHASILTTMRYVHPDEDSYGLPVAAMDSIFGAACPNNCTSNCTGACAPPGVLLQCAATIDSAR